MAPAAATAWDRAVSAFIEAHFQAHPDAAVDCGRHEFDGGVPDWSREGIEGEIGRLREARAAAAGFPDALDRRRAIEREYLLAVIDRQLFWLETARWHETSPGFYAAALDPGVYVKRDYAPLEARLRGFNVYARAVPEALGHMRSNLRTPLPASYARYGRTSIGGLAAYLDTEVADAFRPVKDEALHREFETARAAAAAAFREADAWFAAQEADGGDGFALGRDRFEEMLRVTEQVGLPLVELEEAARDDLARNRAALVAACKELAAGDSVAACVARVQARKPPEGPVHAAARQLEFLSRFLADRNLVTMPDSPRVIVEETPVSHRWNAGMIDIPGPYESHLPAIYYITPPDASWSTEERARYLPGEADLLFMSVHEVWPGHYLHYQIAGREPSKFGRIFTGYAFSEGWAHYAEELMCASGLCGDDPARRIGQLLNALIRNVRFVAALGLHAGDLRIEEVEEMFAQQAFQDPMNARQQAARGTFDPGYLSYTLGKLMIRKLRDDWLAEQGGSLRDFHDRLLAFGGPPIPLARRALLSADRGGLL